MQPQDRIKGLYGIFAADFFHLGMTHARGGPEDDSVLGALRTEVLMNHMDEMLVILESIRAEHPYYGFNCRDSQQRTALHASCEPQVSTKIMGILLQHENLMYGGYPNDQTLEFKAALMMCVKCDTTYVTRVQRMDAVTKAKMLLESGASVSLAADFSTPLRMVGSLEMVTLLFEYGAGADINRINFFGMSALMMSVEKCDVSVPEFLLQHGADMSIGSRRNPYTHAAIRSMGLGGSFNDNNMNIDMLVFVLEKGADITLGDSRHRTVLEVASNMNNRYAVRLIKLVLAELPSETAKWTRQFEAICQSLRMSHHKRDTPMPAMNVLPPDMIRRVMQHVQSSHPINMVAAAMSSIKERHDGRFPIRDTDVLPDSDDSGGFPPFDHFNLQF